MNLCAGVIRAEVAVSKNFLLRHAAVRISGKHAQQHAAAALNVNFPSLASDRDVRKRICSLG
jgi:hypothetical protein